MAMFVSGAATSTGSFGDGRFANNVGIGTNAPGDYHADADNLVIYGSGNAGIKIEAGTSKDSEIYMADGTSGDAEYRGYLNYEIPPKYKLKRIKIECKKIKPLQISWCL